MVMLLFRIKDSKSSLEMTRSFRRRLYARWPQWWAACEVSKNEDVFGRGWGLPVEQLRKSRACNRMRRCLMVPI